MARIQHLFLLVLVLAGLLVSVTFISSIADAADTARVLCQEQPVE